MFAAKNELFSRPSAGGYNLTRSLRFRSSASAYLNRTFSVAGNVQTYTISFWAKRGVLSTTEYLFVGFNGSVSSQISFNSSDQLQLNVDGGNGYQITTSAVYRDPAAWYHIVATVDTTQATASNRLKLYVNGTQITSLASSSYPTQNASTYFFGATGHWIGSSQGPGQYFDGYLAEFNAINGQALTPSSFGAFSIYNQWLPKKYAGTYGTNGFYLPFTDNSAATPVGLGKDFSGNTGTTVTGTTTSGLNTMTVVSLTGIAVGNTITGLGIPAGTYVTAASVLTVTMSQNASSSNASQSYTFSGNNWTTNNISVTAGSTYDSMTDVPTLTSATAANFAVMNPLIYSPSAITFSNGNLVTTTTTAGGSSKSGATFGASAGKFYAEATITTYGGELALGVIINTSSNIYTTGVGYDSFDGSKYVNGTNSAYGATYGAGAVIGIALDLDGQTVTFYKNNTSQGTISLPTASSTWIFAHSNGSTVVNVITWNFGQQPFTYTPPSGFVALNTFNL